MSEGGDSYDPGPWRGFDYNAARSAYDSTAGRGYGGSGYSSGGSSKSSTKAGKSSAYAPAPYKPSGKTLDDLVPKLLTTDARSPVAIITDGTGSMGEFPEVIFKKLPLLDLGIKDYFDDPVISVAMIGDADGDKYPLQVQPFCKGTDLVTSLNNLTIEGGGGGNQMESYDLGALYYARNCQMPKAVNPMLIWICDEGIYPSVDPTWAKNHARVDMKKAMPSRELFEELKRKFSVYCIRKHYQNGVAGDKMTGANLAIHKQWEDYVGADHIAVLNDPNRVVDVIFGLCADHTGRQDFFKEELEFRQKPEQVAQVMKSMVAIGRPPKALLGDGKSIRVKR